MVEVCKVDDIAVITCNIPAATQRSSRDCNDEGFRLRYHGTESCVGDALFRGQGQHSSSRGRLNSFVRMTFLGEIMMCTYNTCHDKNVTFNLIDLVEELLD